MPDRDPNPPSVYNSCEGHDEELLIDYLGNRDGHCSCGVAVIGDEINEISDDEYTQLLRDHIRDCDRTREDYCEFGHEPDPDREHDNY